MTILSSLFEYINSPELQAALLPAKIVMGSVGIFFVIAVIVLISKTSWIYFAYIYDLHEYNRFKPYGLPATAKHLKAAIYALDNGTFEERKKAIVELDTLLGTALERIGFAGKDTEDRLNKMSPTSFQDIEELKQAHHIRKAIEENPEYVLPYEEAERLVGVYRKAFASLDLS